MSLAQRASMLDVARTPGAEADASLIEARDAPRSVSRSEPFRRLFELPSSPTESDLQRRSTRRRPPRPPSRAIELVQQRGDRLRLRSVAAAIGARPTSSGATWTRPSGARPRVSQAFDEERAAHHRRRRDFRRSMNRGSYSRRRCSSRIKKKDYPRAFAMAERARARIARRSKKLAPIATLAERQQALAARRSHRRAEPVRGRTGHLGDQARRRHASRRGR